MADTAATERRVRPIQDAIDSGNWKQALKESDKWLKKGESSDRFLALRARILIQQNDGNSRNKGIKELLGLCHKEPPVLNIDAIKQLQDSLAVVNLENEEGSKVWQRAILVRPNDGSMITTWLNSSLSRGDWLSAQKATTALKKAFPKDKTHDFSNILMCFMIHEDVSLPDKDRKLFGTLASRFITKAANDQAISNIDELALLAAILDKTGLHHELIHLLQAPTLQSVAEQDKNAADHLLIDAAAASNDYKLIFNTARQFLLSDATDSHIEDDRIWALLEKAATSDNLHADCLAITTEKLQHSKADRRALMARLNILCAQPQESAEGLIETFSKYYDLFGMKSFLFDDLAPILSSCDNATIATVVQMFATRSENELNLNKIVHNLKLRHLLLIRKEAQEEDMLALAADALDAHLKYLDSTNYTPEAALLAITSLLEASGLVGNASLLHQANVLTQALHARYNDYYPFSVILLQIQRCMGHATLAMDTFLQLNIKNLQWETLGHLILERISYLHPYQYGRGKDALNPLGGLDSAIGVVANSQRAMHRAIRDGLKLGSYANVLDTIKLQANVKQSINVRLCAFEQRKVQRTRGLPILGTLPDMDVDYSDLRDTAFMPRYGTNQDDLVQKLASGPRPGKGWLALMHLHDSIMECLGSDAAALTSTAAKRQLDTLSHCVAKLQRFATDLTDDEKMVSGMYEKLARVVLDEAGPNGQSSQLVSLLDELSVWQTRQPLPHVDGVEFPSFAWLQHQFLHIELIGTISRFVSKKQVVKSKQETPTESGNSKSEAIVKLTSAVKSHSQAILEECHRVKQQLREAGVLGKLIDAAMWRTTDEDSSNQNILVSKVAQCLDEAMVEQYCSELRESWEDAVEGVLKAATAL